MSIGGAALVPPRIMLRQAPNGTSLCGRRNRNGTLGCAGNYGQQKWHWQTPQACGVFGSSRTGAGARSPAGPRLRRRRPRLRPLSENARSSLGAAARAQPRPSPGHGSAARGPVPDPLTAAACGRRSARRFDRARRRLSRICAQPASVRPRPKAHDRAYARTAGFASPARARLLTFTSSVVFRACAAC